jgi:hypothetical protein
MDKLQLPNYQTGIDPVDYIDFDRMPALVKFLKERQFLLRDLGVAPRIFYQWKEFGLLDEGKPERKWVKLDFGQFFWLRIVQDLRKFGVPLEDILRIKKRYTRNLYSDMESILSDDQRNEFFMKIADSLPGLSLKEKEEAKLEILDKNTQKEIFEKIAPKSSNLLDMCIIHMVAVGKPTYLTLFLTDDIPNLDFEKVAPPPAGSPGKRKKARRQSCIEFILHMEEFENYKTDLALLRKVEGVPHIKLPLHHYIKEFISDLKNEKRLEQSAILSNEEMFLLKELRKDNVTEIKIIMNQHNETSEKDINRIEVTIDLKKNAEARLIETFTSKEYADISYKVADGQIVSFRKTTKKKLK